MINGFRQNRPELDAIRTPSPLEIAWSAGIYEGEGHCRSVARSNRGVMVTVVQKDPELLYRLKDMFGGSINSNGKGGCFSLELCGDRCRLFIAAIYGYMTARRKAQIDATEALDFLEGVNSNDLSFDRLKEIIVAFNLKRFNKTSRNPEVRNKSYNTDEYRKSHREYERNRQQKKNALHVVEIENSA